MVADYLEKNSAYWGQGYDAANVDHPVFRFYGRILKPQFKLAGNGERLVDFGCGRGAAVDFFNRAGFLARGCDISKADIEAARIRYPLIAHRFDVVSPDPRQVVHYGFGEDVAVVTAIQSLYYFSDTDFAVCMDKIYASMRPGGIFFATMIGEKCAEFFQNSQPAGDGLRRVAFTNLTQKVSDYYVSFIRDEKHIAEKFGMFKPVHVGYYAARFRGDEGDGFHYTFCGIKE